MQQNNWGYQKCTLGVFIALAFMADFSPDAPEFYQRTHRVRLKNSGTSDKKSSHKIKYKKIPRVHKNQKEDFPYGRYTGKKVCPCCPKHTMRSEEERKKLINRLKRVEGQIRGIIGMLENDAYCNDILIQSAAVNAAVNAFNKELLASHIRNCVARDIRGGKDETIDELVATLQKLMK